MYGKYDIEYIEIKKQEEILMMKKIQFYAPGDIRVEEAEIPVPEAGEIVIKNEVTLTCGTDVKTH